MNTVHGARYCQFSLLCSVGLHSLHDLLSAILAFDTRVFEHTDVISYASLPALLWRQPSCT